MAHPNVSALSSLLQAVSTHLDIWPASNPLILGTAMRALDEDETLSADGGDAALAVGAELELELPPADEATQGMTNDDFHTPEGAPVPSKAQMSASVHATQLASAFEGTNGLPEPELSGDSILIEKYDL